MEELSAARRDLDAGDLRTARIRIGNVLQAEPGNLDALGLRGRIALVYGDYRSAFADLERVRSAGGASAEAISIPYAEAAIRVGESSRARAALDSAVGLEDSSDYWLVRAEMEVRAASLEGAAAALERAESLGAAGARYLAIQAQLAALAGDTVRAEQLLRSAVAAEPESGDAHMAFADLLGRASKLVEAAAEFERAAALFRQEGRALREVSALLSMVQALVAINDVDAAAAAADRLAQLAPGGALAAYARGLVEYRRGEFDAATASLQVALNQSPDNPQVLSLLGAVHLARGNLGQAEQQLLRALRDNPGEPAASKLLAETRLRQERPDAALDALRPLAESGVDDPHVGLLTGLASMLAGDVEQAIVYLEQSSALDPGNLLVKVELAKAYVAAGRDDAATRLLGTGIDSASMSEAFEGRLMELLLIARSGDRAGGERVVSALLAEQADDPRAYIVAATYRRSTNEPQQARELLERAVEIDGSHVPARLLLAGALVQEGRAADAETHVERALRLEPGNVQALTALAQLQLMRGARDEAVDTLRRAATDPVAVVPRLILAQIYMQQNRFDDARVVLSEAERNSPENPEVWAVSGALALSEGRVDEAIRLLQAAEARLPNRISLALALADALVRTGRPEEARETLRRMLDRVPQSLPVRAALGSVALLLGAPDEALRIAKSLQVEFPAQRQGYLLEAHVETARRRYGEAASVLRVAHDRQPSRELVAELVAVLQLAGRVDEAVDAAEEWVSQNPSDLQGRVLLAAVLQASGRAQEALAHYERVLASDGNNVMALNNAAWLLLDLGQPERGLPLAERAIALAPQNAAVLDTLGSILVRQERERDAVIHLQKAVLLAPDSPEIRYHLAQAQVGAGQIGDARATLEALLAENRYFEQRDAARALLEDM